MQAWGVLMVAAALAAVVDWWAVAGGRRSVEVWAKPVTMALLVGVAATAGDPDGAVRVCLVVGAVLGFAGDIALMSSGATQFMIGLGSFAAGHLAYTAAAVFIGFELVWALPGIVYIVALLGFRFVTRTVPGARAAGGSPLAVAVAFYAVVISAMVITAWGTGAWVAGVGAMAFAASDWVLGHERFVGPVPGGRISVIVPYHVGQALLLVGLARA